MSTLLQLIRKGMMFRTAASLVLVTLLFSCNITGRTKRRTPLHMLRSDTVRYVGMKTCRNCHADIYESFLKTGMGKSFDVAGRQKSSARFRITRRSSIVIVTCVLSILVK